MTRALVFFVLLLGAMGCAAPTAMAPTPTLPRATETSAVAMVSVFEDIQHEPIYPNTEFPFRLKLEPMLYRTGKTANGTSYSSSSPDPNPTVREMRVCFQFASACTPNGEWMPFQKSLNEKIPIDWLGERELFYAVEFRDAAGGKIPSRDELENRQAHVSIESVLDTRTPMASQPAFVQTQVAVTRVAFPVTGSIQIQNGMCCAGGKVNSTIELTADFSANSSIGNITEMRLLHQCATPQEMERATWEPFVAQKKFPFKISVANWVGWYLAVQYRDDKGNLSPVYCDDISIEGMQ